MQETQVQSLGRKDSPEMEVAAHSSILTRGIPWTEEPGGPKSRTQQLKNNNKDIIIILFVLIQRRQVRKRREADGQRLRSLGSILASRPYSKGQGKSQKGGPVIHSSNTCAEVQPGTGPGCRQKGPTCTLSRSSNSNELLSPCLLPPSHSQTPPHLINQQV